MVTLRDYQEETLTSLVGPDATAADLAVVATGGGKTIIFAELLNRMLAPGKRGLVLAHRDELIDQAVDKIKWVAPDLMVEREKAEARAHRTAYSTLWSKQQRVVVVASVQTLRGKRLEEWPKDAFDIIICDEAHHATAPSYVAIFEYFNARRIGVTATPSRTDGKPLGDVFTRIAVDFGIRHLVQRGWLVPVNARVVRTNTDLSGVKQSAGDYAIGELERAVNVSDRNSMIIAAVQRWSEGRQTIVYCAGVDHAIELSAQMSVAGIPTEAIWGDMPMENRRDALARFRAGTVRALTNFGVLTEGFDEPKVGCIVLARPTQSVLLLTQMVGRGTRPLEEIAGTLDATDPYVRRETIAASIKPNLIVIDVQDVSHRMTATAATLAGLPRQFDPMGDDIFQQAEEIERLDPRLVARCLNAEKLRELLAKVAQGLSVSEIDVLSATNLDPAVTQFSRFVWASTGPETFALRVNGATFSISANTLGSFTIARQDRNTWAWTTVRENLPDVVSAFKFADNHIAEMYPDKLALLDSGARWRSDSPSEKQIGWLIKKGVFASRNEIPDTMTKGQASQLLDEAFAKGGRR
jgi:superfamily II DNA or RNA helicase